MRNVYSLILAGICCSAVPSAAFAMPIPDCAGQVEISNAHVIRVEKNGVLVLSDGRAVTLEGIRLAGADRGEGAIADDALTQLRALAMARPLTLTSTPPKEDRYDRVRVQAFGDSWLQLEMLRRGLARVQTAPDRNECAPDFYEAEQAARAAGRGLWAQGAAAVRKPGGLAGDVGSFQIVEGRVTNIASRDSGTIITFDTGRGFAAVIAPDDRRAFRNLDPPLESLTGRRMRVRGLVEEANGQLQIALSNPSQIELLP
jgi:micrococcal nuclease